MENGVVKLSEYFFSTYKEDPGNSDILGYSLSTRAGLIKKTAAGIYTFMPIGFRVLKKIEKIVREEMDRAGAHELLMPAMQPADLWIQSGRWNQYGPELFRLKDRNGRDFCLGPTHEEVITSIASQNIKSYKDMPVNIYQIQVKFRDEIRPRYGILRAREFIMKDAYSFSANQEDLDDIYEKMYVCYSNIIERLGLRYFAVEADTGLIGGKYSHEFIILANNGEDELAHCPACGYSANFEMARFRQKKYPGNNYSQKNNKICAEPPEKISEIFTPGITNIKSLVKFTDTVPENIMKTMFLKDSNKNIYAFIIGGERELNIAKAEKVVGSKLELAEEQDFKMGLVIGFAGPVGLDKKIKIYADNNLKGRSNMITGANRKDYHLKNVSCSRDFTVDLWGDFIFPLEGDLCINCGSEIKFEKGIEIGHIFKLGTRYSEKMGALFLDSDGKLKPIMMGCYGIGISRILSAVIEQSNDKKGIVWPVNIAPFLANLIVINIEDEHIKTAGDEVYKRLISEKIETVYDDRNVRAGVKFNDSDLMGIPVKLILGKNYTENKNLEIELRKNGSKLTMDLGCAIKFLKEYSRNNSI